MRGGQFLRENPIGLDRLSGPFLRGGGQIYGGRVLDLGLCGATVRTRTLCSDQELRRHHSAASGRARHRLADRRHRNGRGNRQYRVGSPAFLTPGSTGSLVIDSLPMCAWTGLKKGGRGPVIVARLLTVGRRPIFYVVEAIFANVQYPTDDLRPGSNSIADSGLLAREEPLARIAQVALSRCAGFRLGCACPTCEESGTGVTTILAVNGCSLHIS
jgi:hypothetical protein